MRKAQGMFALGLLLRYGRESGWPLKLDPNAALVIATAFMTLAIVTVMFIIPVLVEIPVVRMVSRVLTTIVAIVIISRIRMPTIAI